MRFDSDPLDGVSSSFSEFFRETNTTGGKVVQFKSGLAENVNHAEIGVDGTSSWFGLGGGGVVIFKNTPAADTLDVNGDVAVTGDLAVDGAITCGPGVLVDIVSDEITVVASHHLIDTEADAATDDLFTINGGIDGQLLFLHTSTSSRDVTVKHNTDTQIGNIRLAGEADLTLAKSGSMLTLIFLDPFWFEVSRSIA